VVTAALESFGRASAGGTIDGTAEEITEEAA
jgi:hypothetical protein